MTIEEIMTQFGNEIMNGEIPTQTKIVAKSLEYIEKAYTEGQNDILQKIANRGF